MSLVFFPIFLRFSDSLENGSCDVDLISVFDDALLAASRLLCMASWATMPADVKSRVA